MARPVSALFDIAARREPRIERLTETDVSSALEHRMEGLLYSWAAATNRLAEPAARPLIQAETENWARNEMLASSAVELETHAQAHGVEICFIKGVVLESQVYDRRGERPATDLDVVIRNGSTDRVVDWVTALQPRHRWIPELEPLIAGQHIQAIDLVVGGSQVDLHFDPLKLEIIASRAKHHLLARSIPCDLNTGRVTGLDPEASLVLALVHLNKDRFRRLIGFADVARLIESVQDWDWIVSYASQEGLRVPVLSSLDVVIRTLGLSPPSGLGTVSRNRIWRLAWPDRTHLLGREGHVRFRYRQMLMPMFSGKRVPEAVVGISRRLFPPPPMLRAFYPESAGKYLRALVFGRLRRRLRRARQREEARLGSGPLP